ncbi:hypothetical protein SAMN05444955_11678 [Lihuaxuella thermophila]|uniref:Uncharacterized protein n=1 Tax=Lihuaxuella thermophila TaxID=1173111 RepID=A0A1H8I7Z9_9BACL|nr:hypothetical protein SAMN05444955_11678 [Lihuaxuella thermophila]
MQATKWLVQFILGVYVPVTAILRTYLRYNHQHQSTSK